MSFPTEEAVMSMAERLALALFEEMEIAPPAAVPRLAFAEAMERYGCDKPDTRFGLAFTTVTDIAEGTSFGVFTGAIGAGGVVRGFAAPGQAGLSRKELDELNEVVKPYGGKGVVALGRKDGRLHGAALKHIGEGPAAKLLDAVGASDGDLGLFVAAGYDTACACLSALRLHFREA